MNDNINANLVCERFPVLVDGIGSNKMTKWRTLGYDTGVFCSAYFEAILTIFSTNFHFSFARIDWNRWRWPIDIHVEGIFNSADCILTIVGDTCEVRRKSIVPSFCPSGSLEISHLTSGISTVTMANVIGCYGVYHNLIGLWKYSKKRWHEV